jgi:hypothetical protein
MKRITFYTEDSVKNNKIKSQNYFVKRSFRKYFRIVFLEGKIGFKRNFIKKKTGARLQCDWADALGKMGRGTGSVWDEETR